MRKKFPLSPEEVRVLTTLIRKGIPGVTETNAILLRERITNATILRWLDRDGCVCCKKLAQKPLDGLVKKRLIRLVVTSFPRRMYLGEWAINEEEFEEHPDYEYVCERARR